jgi:hypothetical protein
MAGAVTIGAFCDAGQEGDPNLECKDILNYNQVLLII